MSFPTHYNLMCDVLAAVADTMTGSELGAGAGVGPGADKSQFRISDDLAPGWRHHLARFGH